MSDKNLNFKSHMKLAGKVIYCYFLSLLMAWAGFPIISIFTLRNDYDGISKNVFLPESLAQSKFFYFENINSIFTGIVTFIFIVILFMSMQEAGEEDLKPYKWVKYKCKGFTAGLIASVIIVIFEILVILIADRYINVAHPQWNIKSLHNYVTMAGYAPFYWFYRFADKEANVMPAVKYLSSFFCAAPIIPTAGLGYFIGYSDIHFIKKAPKSKFLRRIIYGKQSKNWEE